MADTITLAIDALASAAFIEGGVSIERTDEARQYTEQRKRELLEAIAASHRQAVAAQAAPAAVAGLDHTAMHDALLWLRSALDCKDWHWSPEQRDCAELAYHASIAALPATEDSSAGDQVGAVHPDDAAVDALAAKMKAKLAKQRAKGYGGWDTQECSQQRLSAMLRDHVAKGDPVDVANFCAFLAARGEGIEAGVQAEPVATNAQEVQWRNIKKVVNALADFCFGSADDPRWGRAHIAIRTSLTAKDGLDILSLGLESLHVAPQAQPADALDAARYRYLRDNCVREWVSQLESTRGKKTLDIEFDADGHDLDAALDAALAKHKEV